MSMSATELQGIEDVGPRIAESIIEYFGNDINRDIVERLRAAGVQMAAEEPAETPGSDLLGGKTFVISGVFAKHSRDQYKEMIEQHGGKNAGSISRKTDYVLAGENMGPAKLQKAQSLGIEIIDEDKFLAMITPATPAADGDSSSASSPKSGGMGSLFDDLE